MRVAFRIKLIRFSWYPWWCAIRYLVSAYACERGRVRLSLLEVVLLELGCVSVVPERLKVRNGCYWAGLAASRVPARQPSGSAPPLLRSVESSSQEPAAQWHQGWQVWRVLRLPRWYATFDTPPYESDAARLRSGAWWCVLPVLGDTFFRCLNDAFFWCLVMLVGSR